MSKSQFFTPTADDSRWNNAEVVGDNYLAIVEPRHYKIFIHTPDGKLVPMINYRWLYHFRDIRTDIIFSVRCYFVKKVEKWADSREHLVIDRKPDRSLKGACDTLSGIGKMTMDEAKDWYYSRQNC